MGKSFPSLEELAVKAQKAAIQAEDDSLSDEVRQQALLEKQIVLTELMTLLMERIKVELPKPSNMGLSEYIYEETLQNLMIYIFQNIDRYNSDKPVMAWVRFLLNKRKNNVFNWLNWGGKVSYKYEGGNKDGDEYEIDFIESYQPPSLNHLPSEKLMEFIQEDPEGLLAGKLFKKNPKASFQAILLKKYEDKSWEEITQELNLGETHGPIYSFYRRCCDEFSPYFRKYLWE
ncbi:hypothetical protein [Brunnivagina elsteri]|uniref:Sigma-70 family RNA polymerase sigma factor n=1 Tax=Brunnivagina elsteri CCALA 953 TaxID=987040 RepID=A0A2A2TMJ6_9CYAN|nr:hypothetical protein [Calothrix elsteri]PAX59652.1 hypothetical protein CK510_06000 [Calothrix elsteri CCALA 953]